MAIPKDLAKALDNLREAIRLAEAEMAKTPGADEVSVHLEDLDTDDVDAYLQFDAGGEDNFYVSFESPNTTKTETVSDMPVVHRLKVAAQIPQFIDKAKEKCAVLAPDVEQLAQAIRVTIDSHKQSTTATELGNRAGRRKRS